MVYYGYAKMRSSPRRDVYYLLFSFRLGTLVGGVWASVARFVFCFLFHRLTFTYYDL